MTSSFYISTGRTNAMFTLWQCLHDRHLYIGNLSTTPTEAFKKAKDLSESMGIPLTTKIPDLDDMLRAIVRMENGISVADKRAAEKLAREEAWKAESDAYFNECLVNGVYPFGPYTGELYSVASVSYINWVATGEFDPESSLGKLQPVIREACSEYLLPIPSRTAITGSVGKRSNFKVTITRVAGYATVFGWTNVITMVTDSGACLVSKGKFCAEVGETLTIKATVKEYAPYANQMQTVVQRVAVI